MKSSDLKVVAIILSIALFFTIITSNAVSIASVVILAKGGSGTGAATQTVAPGTGDQQGTQTTPGGSTSTTPGGTTSTTPGGTTSTTPGGTTSTTPGGTTSTTPGGTTSTTPGGTTSTTPGGSTSTQQGGTTQQGGSQGGQGGSTQASPIDKEALAMFQKAAADINTNGVAGYTKKSWQSIDSIDVGGNDKIKGLIESFLTSEDKAEDKVSAKGSDDAKRRLPASNCSEGKIQSVTKTTNAAGNYVITIVMKDEMNPTKAATDGLNVMSRDLLYMEDVHETVKTNSAVKLLVKSLDKGEITYRAYTITAEMTKDGKFVSITHFCKADLVADAKLIVGSLSGTGVLVFNVKYWDFQY